MFSRCTGMAMAGFRADARRYNEPKRARHELHCLDETRSEVAAYARPAYARRPVKKVHQQTRSCRPAWRSTCGPGGDSKPQYHGC